MPNESKYHRQRTLLEATRAGRFDQDFRTVDDESLEALLDKAYTEAQYFFWYSKFLRYYEIGTTRFRRPRSATTKRKSKYRFVVWLNWCVEKGYDRLPADQLGADKIFQFLSTFDDRPRTKLSHYGDLRHHFNYLLKHEPGCTVRANPMERIPVPQVRSVPTPKTTDKILKRLVGLIGQYEYKGNASERQARRLSDRAILAFMLSTAARREAVASLKLSDIDWERAEVTYSDKGHFGVKSPVADAIKELRAYLGVRKLHGPKKNESQTHYLERVHNYNRVWSPDRTADPLNPEADGIFFRRSDGLPATPEYISSVFFRFKRWLGEKNFAPHMIRKHRGRQAYRDTKDIVKVKALMGHSTIQMTMQYLELAEDERMEFMDSTSPVRALFG